MQTSYFLNGTMIQIVLKHRRQISIVNQYGNRYLVNQLNRNLLKMKLKINGQQNHRHRTPLERVHFIKKFLVNQILNS